MGREVAADGKKGGREGRGREAQRKQHACLPHSALKTLKTRLQFSNRPDFCFVTVTGRCLLPEILPGDAPFAAVLQENSGYSQGSDPPELKIVPATPGTAPTGSPPHTGARGPYEGGCSPRAHGWARQDHVSSISIPIRPRPGQHRRDTVSREVGKVTPRAAPRPCFPWWMELRASPVISQP